MDVPTHLTGGNGSNAVTTAGITPTAGTMVFIFIGELRDTGFGGPAATPADNAGANPITFTEVITESLDDATLAFNAGIREFRGLVPAGRSAAATITITGDVRTGPLFYSVEQQGGADTSGTNGSSSIAQSPHGTGAETLGSVTINYAAFGSASNGCLAGFFTTETGNSVPSPSYNAGWVELANVPLFSSGIGYELTTAYKTSSDTTAKADFNLGGHTINNVYGIADEIALPSVRTAPDDGFAFMQMSRPHHTSRSVFS